MNAPVIATLPGARPAAPRASESGRAHSAAPFASALDGALSESRSAHAPDRGAPDRADLAERAAHRDAEKDQRPAQRSDAATRRAGRPHGQPIGPRHGPRRGSRPGPRHGPRGPRSGPSSPRPVG